MTPEALARLEREYGHARPVTYPWSAAIGYCIGATGDVTLVDCGDSRIIVIDDAGHEVLHDLKAAVR